MAKTTHTEVFNCSVQEFYDLVSDYEKYPEFINEVKAVEILKNEDGTKLVKYDVSVIKTISYVLETRETPPSEIHWDFTKGDIFKTMSGSWILEDEAGKCRAQYTVDATFGVFVPGPITKTLQTVNLRSMMSAFHKRIQEVYGG